MNILITSAGRRGYLVKFFKEVIDGKVYVSNSDKYSPAFFYADETVITPLIYDEEYIPFLINYCIEKEINAIIPVFDVDVFVLSKWKERFLDKGIKLVVSSPDIVTVCNDKWNTYRFCKENQILTCETFLDIENAEKALICKEIHFPLFIKPRWGMGSLEIFEADNQEEMIILYEKCRKNIQKSYLKYESAYDKEHCVVIQEKIEGQEYGLDIFNDLNGCYKSNVVRRKLGMRAGETDIAIIERNIELDKFAKKLSSLSKHVANLDVDIFVSNNGIYLLEMNARFGGGYPFGHLAGVNFPKAIVKMLKEEEPGEELEIKTYGQIMQKDIGFVIY